MLIAEVLIGVIQEAMGVYIVYIMTNTLNRETGVFSLEDNFTCYFLENFTVKIEKSEKR